jgi:hypothetical protein
MSARDNVPGAGDLVHRSANSSYIPIDWRKQRNGQGYTSRLADLLGRNPTADLSRHGKELEAQFRKALDAAEAAQAGRAAS